MTFGGYEWLCPVCKTPIRSEMQPTNPPKLTGFGCLGCNRWWPLKEPAPGHSLPIGDKVSDD